MATAPAGAPDLLRGEPTRGRPLELQDWLNRFVYHPLAARLARLLRPTGISPDAVSVVGALLVWAAAYAYTGIAWPQGELSELVPITAGLFRVGSEAWSAERLRIDQIVRGRALRVNLTGVDYYRTFTP